MISGLCCLMFFYTHSQIYHFTNYNIESGLIQSQATDITQDKNGFLWVSTYGGVSRFDGKSFISYSKANGMINSFTYSIADFGHNNILIGTQNGLSHFNGYQFLNYTIASYPRGNFVNKVIGSENNKTAWILAGAGYQLYTLIDKKISPVSITGKKEFVSTIYQNKRGTLFACVAKQGVFSLQNGSQWQAIPDPDQLIKHDFIKDIFQSDDEKLWLLGNKAVYVYQHGRYSVYKVDGNTAFLETALSLLVDKNENIWIGSSKGVYRIKNGSITHLTSANGFSDKTVNKIFQDKENNIWFATDGEGIFRYSGDMFTSIGSGQGLSGSLVMGLAEDEENKIWIGVSENGLMHFDGKKIEKVTMPNVNPFVERINSLYYNKPRKELWVGTYGGGLWKMRNSRFEQVSLQSSNMLNTVNHIWKDNKARLWIATPSGCASIDSGKPKAIKGIHEFTSSFLQFDADRVLVGTASGLYTVNHAMQVEKVKHKLIEASSVFCLTWWNNKIVIGTSDNGVLIWNPADNSLRQLTKKEGMSSDFIYSLLVDRSNNIWAGTGNGVTRISNRHSSGNFQLKNFGVADGLMGLECNSNVMMIDHLSRIWFGTNKGAFIYNPKADSVRRYPPRLVLKSVKLFSKEIVSAAGTDTLISWYRIPDKLVLTSNQNDISFEFAGISLSEPESILYQYKLDGLNNAYSGFSTNNSIVFPGLPHGNYTLRVRAKTSEGIPSANEISFSFEIKAPFYKTIWFQFIVIIFLIGSGAIVQAVRSGLREKAKRKIQKMRDEEQLKVRQRTSEDFHDEMGNKLTRITILSDILQSKLGESKEELRIVGQIRDNAVALYRGTKDILWALDPGSDNLYETIRRIHDFGTELYQDTTILFEMKGIDSRYEQIKLPIDYSRNILMICKEALNNVLKYAECTKVEVVIKVISEKMVKISIKDNGKGFHVEEVKSGNGLKNIVSRAARINGYAEIESNPQTGTVINIIIKFPDLV